MYLNMCKQAGVLKGRFTSEGPASELWVNNEYLSVQWMCQRQPKLKEAPFPASRLHTDLQRGDMLLIIKAVAAGVRRLNFL